MRHRRRDNEDSPAEHRRGPPPRKASQPDTPRHPWAPTLLVRPRSGERRRCYWRNWPEKCTKAPKPAQAQTVLKPSLPDPASSPSHGGNYRIRRCSDCGGNEQFEPVVPRLCQMVGREAFWFLSNYPRSASSFPVLSSSLGNRDYNGATVPLYGYAAPAYGYAATAPLYNYAAPVADLAPLPMDTQPRLTLLQLMRHRRRRERPLLS